MTKNVAVAFVAITLIAVTPVSAAVYKRIASESASGDYAIAIAAGNANKPKALYVQTSATPRQKVSVEWTTVCSKGFGAGSKSGSYETSSALRRKIRVPMANPDSCTASASGSLDRGGKITVRIFKR